MSDREVGAGVVSGKECSDWWARVLIPYWNFSFVCFGKYEFIQYKN
jgi:hypothetical protein